MSTHRTIAVASVATGAPLSPDITEDERQAVRTAALGHPVPPHLAETRDVVRSVRRALYAQHPGLPSAELADEDPAEAIAQAIAAMGETVEVTAP